MVLHGRKILVFTDGGCSGNPGVGGYGAIVQYEGLELLTKGGELHTTNNKMELQAIISGLESALSIVDTFDDGFLPSIEVYSDSTYALYALDHKWRATALKKQKKANLDLIESLDFLLRRLYSDHLHLIVGQHVKGHSGHPENERCDQLAQEGIANMRAILESTRRP